MRSLALTLLLSTAASAADGTILNDSNFQLTEAEITRFLAEGYGASVATVHVYQSARNFVSGGLDYLKNTPAAPYRREVTFSVRPPDGDVLAVACDLLVDDAQDSLSTENCEAYPRQEIKPYTALLSKFTQIKP